MLWRSLTQWTIPDCWSRLREIAGMGEKAPQICLDCADLLNEFNSLKLEHPQHDEQHAFENLDTHLRLLVLLSKHAGPGCGFHRSLQNSRDDIRELKQRLESAALAWKQFTWAREWCAMQQKLPGFFFIPIQTTSVQLYTQSKSKSKSKSQTRKREVRRQVFKRRQKILTRTYLPITLEGTTYEAVADTGSSENVMSTEFAASIGATVEQDEAGPSEFSNARGDLFVSVGRATINFAFPDDPDRTRECVFEVVSTLAVPLIMGRQFLAETLTLTEFTYRLKKVHHISPLAAAADQLPRVLHLDVPRRRLTCSLDDEPALANADTGSDIDLVSLEYARERHWPVHKIRRGNCLVQLADGSLVELAGKVCVKFRVEGDGKCASSASVRRTFYVLEGLSSDVLLGNTTLDELSVFTDYLDAFIDIAGEGTAFEMNLIIWKWNAKRRAARRLAFEALLDIEDADEAEHRTAHRKKVEALVASGPTGSIVDVFAEVARLETAEAERQKKYESRRAHMVQTREVITQREFKVLLAAAAATATATGPTIPTPSNPST